MNTIHPITKITSPSQIIEWCDWKRRIGHSIVLTNGCFDILHRGHNHHLQEVSRLGSILVVGVDCDARVRRLKGETRPINNQDDRAYNLACHQAVDAVFIFEDEFASYIRSIKPDTYTKAGYTYSTINPEERDALDEVGAFTKFFPLVEGHSTTNLIQKIHERI